MADFEQLNGESNGSYSHFLAYRNLGPTRTLDKAYRVVKGDEGLSAPGSWQRESIRFRWVERAEAWDIAMLSEAGARVVTCFVAAMEALAQAVADGLVAHRPASYAEALEGLRILGPLVPAETVEALQQTAAQGATPAIGGPSPDPIAIEAGG